MIIVLLMKFVLMLKIQISKYQYLIKKRKENNLKNLKILEIIFFIESSNNKQVVYKNLGEYYSSAKCNVLIVFNDMIADND